MQMTAGDANGPAAVPSSSKASVAAAAVQGGINQADDDVDSDEEDEDYNPERLSGKHFLALCCVCFEIYINASPVRSESQHGHCNSCNEVSHLDLLAVGVLLASKFAASFIM